MPRAVPLPKSIVCHQSKKCLLFSRGALVRRLRVRLYHQVALVTARVNALGEEGGLPGGGGARSHSLQVQASVQSAVEAATVPPTQGALASVHALSSARAPLLQKA